MRDCRKYFVLTIFIILCAVSCGAQSMRQNQQSFKSASGVGTMGSLSQIAGNKFSPTSKINNASTPQPSAPFSKTLTLQKITFTITSPNSATKNFVTIKPRGLSVSNEVITREINGIVTKAEITDLNEDFSPEIFIYVTTNDADQRGSIVAYSANRKRTITEIYLPELDPGSKEGQGYRGRDDFATAEGTFVRSFPIYRENAGKWEPTKKTRQLQYKLKAGEAGWQLVLDRETEY